MGRINIGVVHETAVRGGFDDFQYFERSINGGRDAWEIHNGNVSKSSNNNSGSNSASNSNSINSNTVRPLAEDHAGRSPATDISKTHT